MWIHYTTPETKEQSKQWLPKGSRPPRKAKVVLSAKKIMATVFFDSQGVVYTTYTSNTINSNAYIESVRECNHKLSRKRRASKRGWNFRLHHDNAKVHTSKATMDFLGEKGLPVVPHPPYSPDLAPCDFWLFPTLKKKLGGSSFANLEEVKMAVGRIFNALPKEAFEEALKDKWVKRWKAVVDNGDDYVEKL